MRYTLLFFVGLLFFSSGCTEQQRERLAPVPTAFGELNQVIMVMDDEVWDSPIGDSIQYIFAGPYPLLPQPEPILDLRFYTPAKMHKAPARKEFRNIVVMAVLNNQTSAATRMVRDDISSEKIAQLGSEKPYATFVRKDRWAKGQQVIYVVGRSADDLLNAVRQQSSSILTKIRSQELDLRSKRIYGQGLDRGLELGIIDAFGVKMKIPKGFVQAIYDEEEDFMWLRRNARKGLWNLMIHELPYQNPDQLTAEGIKQIRDRLGRKFVSSELPNTYMLINDEDLPVITNSYSNKNAYVVEARGIWEMENDFMGGPFISYLYYHEPTNKLLFLDAFVFAPNEQKRDMMQALDFVLGSIEFEL